jgi:hypothetical protein
MFSDCKTAKPQDCTTILARMAELVDALVSNTSGSNAVPVRSRLRVPALSLREGFLFSGLSHHLFEAHFIISASSSPELTKQFVSRFRIKLL